MAGQDALEAEATAFYKALIQKVVRGEELLEQALVLASKEAHRQYALPAVLAHLADLASQTVTRSPRQGYIVAAIAHEMAKLAGEEGPFAHYALTLAEAAGRMGLWEQAARLYESAQTRFREEGEPLWAARCQFGLATAYHHLDRNDEAWGLCVPTRGVLIQEGTKLDVARCDLVMAHICREREQYRRALVMCQRAKEAFIHEGSVVEAALCDRDMAYIYLCWQNSYGTATKLLQSAQQVLQKAGLAPDVASCHHIMALICIERGQYNEALGFLEQATAIYRAEGMQRDLDSCGRTMATAYRRVGRYDEALHIYQRLRESAVAQGLEINIAKLDMNIAMTYKEMNRYGEALRFYQKAEETCLRAGLTLGAARCQANLALLYEAQGQYDRALELHYRARDIFAQAEQLVNVAHCDENMGQIYFLTNQAAHALALFQKAREVFIAEGMSIPILANQVNMAQAYKAMGDYPRAMQLLQQAKEGYAAAAMPLHVALCDLFLADIFKAQRDFDLAMAAYRRAQETFVTRNLPINVGLCDLGLAEVYRAEGEHDQARRLYGAALAIFETDFPDWAWRAHYGLGRCHQQEGKGREALAHYRHAVDNIRRSRGEIYTARAAGAFFADRQHVYDEAILLAAELGEGEQLFEIIEQSKAQAFLTLLYNRGTRLCPRKNDRPYLRKLMAKEAALQSQIDFLQNRLYLADSQRVLAMSQDEAEVPIDQDLPQMHRQLATLRQEHEAIVARLTRARPLLATLYQPPQFSLAAFRQQVSSQWIGKWGCLAYYLTGDQLVIAYLDANGVRYWLKSLGAYERRVLELCVSADVLQREHIYRGTIMGYTTDAMADSWRTGKAFLSDLYELLIPEEVLKALSPDDLLVIAPHSLLHALPFHALLAPGEPETYLAQQATLLYVPSLHTWRLLLAANDGKTEGREGPGRVLLCGASNFGWRAPGLRHVRGEVERLRRLFGTRCDLLWEEEATRERINALDASGELERYRIVHLATHARFDDTFPWQSRILLHDADLTVPAIFKLSLGADIVTLSACEGALQDVYVGDETVGLANAFFLAGARALVVSLWKVEDESTGEFMYRFYANIEKGQSVPEALCAVQREMIAQGYNVYQWAPFIALGDAGPRRINAGDSGSVP